MGEVEEKSRRRAKKQNIEKFILASVQLAGMLAIGLVAPNVLGAMAKLGLLPRRRQTESIHSARDRLIRAGLLAIHTGKLALTTTGEQRLRELELRDFHFKKPKKWDGRWRILIFDIPEAKKAIRDKIRRTLIAIGFVRLQDSVWIFPYDCENLVTLLKADFNIGRDLLYLVIEALEGDERLRQLFGIR